MIHDNLFPQYLLQSLLIIVPIKIFGLVNKSFSQYILCNIKEQVITTLCAPHHLITAPILNNHYYKIAKEKSSFTFPTILLKRLSDFKEFLTLLQACNAVVWSLPPKCIPMVDSDKPRSSLQR